MNHANNAYSAFNATAPRAGPPTRRAAFIAAWRRVVIILRGGPVARDRHAAWRRSASRRCTVSAPADRSPSRRSPSSGRPRRPARRTSRPTARPPTTRATPTSTGSEPTSTAGSRTSPALTPSTSSSRNKPFAFGEWAIWGGDSPELRQPVLRLGQRAQARADDALQPGLRHQRPVRLNGDPASTAAIRQRSPPRASSRTRRTRELGRPALSTGRRRPSAGAAG